MSANEIDFSCIGKFTKKLEDMKRKGTEIMDEALTRGGNVILDEMKSTSQFSDRTGKLRKGLSISKPKTIKGVRAVKIGIQKDDNSEIFYGKFIEYGTNNGKRSIAAKPYMRPAFDKKKEEALIITRNVILKGLRHCD